MDALGSRLYVRGLNGVLSVAVIAYLALGLVDRQDQLLAWAPELAPLIVAGMVVAHLASRRLEAKLPRLAMTFVLAALLLLPPPAGLLVALASAAAGLGAGVVGPRRRGMAAFAVTAASVAVVQILYPVARTIGSPGPWNDLVAALVLFVVVQAIAVLLTGLISSGPRAEPDRPVRPRWSSLALESCCVPLGWMLATLLAGGSWAQSAIVAAIVLLGEVTLLKLSVTQGALGESNRSLESRLSELETLHAIGREIVSSLKPERAFAIVERECRKIFPLDSCFIALSQPAGTGLDLVYRRRRGASAWSGSKPLEQGLAVEVAQKKQGLRIDDLDSEPVDSPLRVGPVDPHSRSALTVPLIIEERVIGVLSIQSDAPAAYDDHQLSVLTTVAQQAASAIEHARAYRRATVDSLTGFFLRDYFFKRLDEEHKRVTRYGGAFSLLMLDLDGFKEINDRQGHLAGDQYLREVSAAIRGELRAADLACRYGGDEFCLLLPQTELEGARVIAERIRAAVARQIVGVQGVALRTTASIGVTAFPLHAADDPTRLLRNADEALYRAKRAGKDCVVPYAA